MQIKSGMKTKIKWQAAETKHRLEKCWREVELYKKWGRNVRGNVRWCLQKAAKTLNGNRNVYKNQWRRLKKEEKMFEALGNVEKSGENVSGKSKCLQKAVMILKGGGNV